MGEDEAKSYFMEQAGLGDFYEGHKVLLTARTKDTPESLWRCVKVVVASR